MPDKKEQEEIQNLKQQIKELQEEVKKKETKWSITHMCLSNKIETLTKENTELGEEIKFMEKVCLESWKKADTGESKERSDRPRALLRRSESVIPQCVKTEAYTCSCVRKTHKGPQKSVSN